MAENTPDSSADRCGVVCAELRAVPFAAIGRSGHRTTARDMEDLLAHACDADAGDG